MADDGTWVVGLAEHLDDVGVGRWITAGTYAAGDVAIKIGELPPGSATGIGLIPYALDDEHGGSSGERAVQITMRAPDMLAVLALQGGVFRALDHKTLRLNGVNVPLIWRQIPGVMAPDESKREVLQDSYYLRIVRS